MAGLFYRCWSCINIAWTSIAPDADYYRKHSKCGNKSNNLATHQLSVCSTLHCVSAADACFEKKFWRFGVMNKGEGDS